MKNGRLCRKKTLNVIIVGTGIFDYINRIMTISKFNNFFIVLKRCNDYTLNKDEKL